MPVLTIEALCRGPLPAEAIDLLREYRSWWCGQALLAGRPGPWQAVAAQADDEVVAGICEAAPAGAAFYLVRADGQAAAIGGWRALAGPDAGVAELKRVYVRPSWRGRGIGGFLLGRLLADLPGRTVVLDTAPFMSAARRLYLAHGFVDGPAHEGTEVPPALHRQWHFMRRARPE